MGKLNHKYKLKTSSIMTNINKMALFSILPAQACAFSVPVSKPNNKAPDQTDMKLSTQTQSSALTSPRSFIRQLDDIFPSPFRSRFDDLFDSPLLTSMDMMSFFDDFDRKAANLMLKTTRVSPGYEISEDEKSMTLVIDVPGVKLEDITVEIEADGKILHVFGKRMRKEHNTESESQFDKRFGIGGRFDYDNVTANLEDGVLTIIAPKINEKKDSMKIKITEGPQDQDA